MAVTPAGFGPPAATWSDIGWWAQLMHILLEPWEARMLATLSLLKANITAEQSRKPEEPTSPTPRKKRR